MVTKRTSRTRAAARPKKKALVKTTTPRRKTKLKSSKVGKTPKAPKAPRKAAMRVPDQVMAAVQGALDKKAEKLELLDLRDGLAFTDFFIICTGNNVRQVQAIADGIQESLRENDVRPALVEGYQRAEWILLDYFDFIVHIFTPATRDFYALDRLWGDAKRVEVSAT
jgi:ribosome-associated protein